MEMDNGRLWSVVLAGGPAVPSFGLKRDLDEHLAMLEREFAGKPAIAFLHAGLTVLIRRGICPDLALGRFFGLWDAEAQRLAGALDSRWLVSAMDSFADHGRNGEERALALAGTLFMNTIKLYETEREFTGQRAAGVTCAASHARAGLDDGMSTFVVGHGDMVKNLLQRAGRADQGPTGVILQSLVARAQRMDTVFRRFRDVHQKEDSRW